MAENGQKVLRGVSIGSTTLCLFVGLPVAQAGWLLKAWLAYREDGTEPSSIPSNCLGSWLAVKHEVDAMNAISQKRAIAGTAGMSKRYGKDFVITKPVESGVCYNNVQQIEKEIENTKTTLTGVLPAHTRVTAGATPAPPAPAQGQPIKVAGLEPGLADRLAEAMKAAPLSVAEAIQYATSVHCGLTPPQVLEWAEWNAEKGWARDSGGNLHKLTADGARASMRRWKNRQPEIDALRRGRSGNGGDVTVRGVRVSNKGGALELDL